MSSQDLNILNRRVVAGTSHGDEIIVENETNEATQEATDETNNHIAKQILTDFCDNSTVQGVRYLTKPKLHWIERYVYLECKGIFLAAIVSSLLFCFIGMSNLWQTWNRNPVIVKYDDKITSISKFPFPAITICPTKKFSKETVNIDKILKALGTNDSAWNDFTPSEWFFGSERSLLFFQSYTQNKCELECLTNFTKNECGCVHFSMPRRKSTRVCTMLNMDCYFGARYAFGKNQVVEDCDCLPDCTSLSYNVGVSQAQQPFYIKKAEMNRMNERFYGLNDTSLSITAVSFNEPHFIMMMRTETGTMFDFISNCGSLLGMCLGVSILSIVELVYFSTLRLYLLWRGQELDHTTNASHGTLTSIIKRPFKKLWLRFKSKKPKHEIITVRPICDENPDQIWNESEMQSEDVETQKQFCHKVIEDFCNNSTIHGLRYLTEPHRHRVERFWWTIAVTLSIVICIIAMFSIWTNWQQNPVITAFDDGRTPIETIPFPAVTVCSTKPYILSKMLPKILKAIREGISAIKNLSDAELCLMNALSQILSLPKIVYYSNITIPSCPSIYETINSMALDEDSAVNHIDWLGHRDPLSFKPIYTPYGRCYSFNSLNSEQIFADDVLSGLKTVHGNPNATYWNREDGYQPNIKQGHVYPRRLYGADISEGMFAHFNTIVDSSDATLSNGIPGLLQLTIHSPDELPGTRFYNLYISSEQDTFVSIRPSVTSTSNGLRSYAPRARGCYYNSERQLRFFKSYSHQKCEWECVTNFTKSECGCVHFPMPSVGGTKMCSMFDTLCYGTAMNEFHLKNKIKECDCLPDCTSISYQVEISTAPFHFYQDDQTENVMKFFHRHGVLTSSRVFVSFKEDHFVTINRTEIMTMSDFISTCGGLFGMFMFSWLSIIEMLYYFTLRMSRKWIQPEADTDSDTEDDNDVAIQNVEANNEAEMYADLEAGIQDNSAAGEQVDTNGGIEVYASIHRDATASFEEDTETEVVVQDDTIESDEADSKIDSEVDSDEVASTSIPYENN